ncbi:type II toxin-antitoxin system HicA family toxin [Sphingomonas sp.]|uniref:type II toxin-antitoxin system HicA family toxin n=1 Tax=Sphingomonas sp. TaxID=28214 RepID=UPI00286EA7F8|nr:type II toxin-antitoxin system HicA family toxin [Sphingomonas sp.]
MVQGYTRQLKTILREHGWEFLRAGKGDHEIWSHPNIARPIVVDARIMSRHTANAVLKQAGVKGKF